MLKYLDVLKEYGMLWHISITGFDKDLEPNVPPIDDVIEDFKYLSSKIGKNAVSWRYTPIIINEKYTKEEAGRRYLIFLMILTMESMDC